MLELMSRGLKVVCNQNLFADAQFPLSPPPRSPSPHSHLPAIHLCTSHLPTIHLCIVQLLQVKLLPVQIHLVHPIFKGLKMSDWSIVSTGRDTEEASLYHGYTEESPVRHVEPLIVCATSGIGDHSPSSFEPPTSHMLSLKTIVEDGRAQSLVITTGEGAQVEEDQPEGTTKLDPYLTEFVAPTLDQRMEIIIQRSWARMQMESYFSADCAKGKKAADIGFRLQSFRWKETSGAYKPLALMVQHI
ncbi:hypothetical protein F511_29768 [Dorcoceras hygrometricum]|uniref:Uncharacterized protein n=1 Tax=Dorcoceras hygrometricum TaxID=472368 RepID=A0A2Z7DHK6_9LAMI|nr:hypothetical protein F511_29768 [Dorcoceras hygrometricum]